MAKGACGKSGAAAAAAAAARPRPRPLAPNLPGLAAAAAGTGKSQLWN